MSIDPVGLDFTKPAQSRGERLIAESAANFQLAIFLFATAMVAALSQHPA
jgi:hypothetical protein